MRNDEQYSVEPEEEGIEEQVSAADQQREEQISRLDEFFSSLQPGVSLLIERLKPSWCSGLLEEIQITDDGIDLAYLIDTWGGQLLSIKIRGKGGRLTGGSYKVPLFSYPPLVFGKRLRVPDLAGRFRDDVDESRPQQTVPTPVVVNQSATIEKLLSGIPAMIPLVLKILENSEQRRQSDLAMMMQVAKLGQGGGLSDITKIGAVMSQLNEMFHQNSGGGTDGGGEIDFMSHAMDIIKMFTDNKQQQQHAAPSKLTGPTPPTPAIASPPPGSTVTKLVPTQGPTQSRNLARTISDLSPQDAAETIIEALGYMSPDKQQAAVGAFLGEYQDIEGDGELEGDEYQEEQKRGMK